MSNVTLHDIARRAGVSVASVSLALRGRGRVSGEKAKAIKEIACELGYRPNPLLAALASKRFSTAKDLQGTPIALFEFPALAQVSRRKPGYYRASIMEEARRLGYAPTLYELSDATPVGPLYRQLYARATQGVVITGEMDMASFGREFDWGQFSVVQCAIYRNDHPFHTLRSNIFQSIKHAFMEVRARSYDRIGFALGRHAVVLEDDETRLGAAWALQEMYLPRRQRIPPYMGDFNDRPAFLAWFQMHRPDAVIAFSLDQYWALRESGIRMPEDIGFALLHQAEKAPDVSGLTQNMDAIGRQAILLLDQLIRHHEKGPTAMPMHLLVPSTWNEGKTLKAAGPVTPARRRGSNTSARKPDAKGR
ncbi:MAG TPA: LacI family DNA-binding transcriptional regulator [Kiritimatiellia bacterium]|nr:LacI family DNA-binding transcriptional regulator [Kiritimatiellia bacterium]HMO99694.1 LacI family DNA-binding transcriptional regulator [Kiritimatiellia bacterium]HMP96132.1 LacI family DNA-binding transcriptional regulator [Kiritimatiellia bacterium]